MLEAEAEDEDKNLTSRPACPRGLNIIARNSATNAFSAIRLIHACPVIVSVHEEAAAAAAAAAAETSLITESSGDIVL